MTRLRLRASARARAIVVAFAVCNSSSVATAQHVHPVGPDTIAGSGTGILARVAARGGSGTSWLPEKASIRGFHRARGAWTVMLDGTATLHYIETSGIRGQWQVGSTNWAMAMADRAVGDGSLQLRAMMSAEPATLTELGYPQHLQVARPHEGGTLTDRQHAHELFSELAARVACAVAPGVGVELYVAAAGEPALGPPAYRHRPSASVDPLAPLGHHAQDITHTTFGVVTFGVFTDVVKIEASVFDGRHPDDDRTDLDLRAVNLRSVSGRVTVNPVASLSLSASWASIDPGDDGAHAGRHDARHRATASLLHARSLEPGSAWSSALVLGVNRGARGDPTLPSWLIETSAELGRTTLFGRAEHLRRSDAELALTGSVTPLLDVSSVSAGIAREVGRRGAFAAHVGVRGTINILPRELEPFYGGRVPMGALVFARVGVRSGVGS